MNYYLNIGSNMGDRRDNLYRAVVALAAGTSGCAVSSIVESEPWGFESENRFMNLGVMLKSDIVPNDMLHRIHDIEHRLGSASHRDERGNYKRNDIYRPSDHATIISNSFQLNRDFVERPVNRRLGIQKAHAR